MKHGANNLLDVFKCLPLSQQAIEEIKEKSRKATEVITTKERKSLTKSIRGTNFLANQSTYLIKLLQDRLKADCNEEEKSRIDESLKGLKRITSIDVASIKASLKLTNRANFASVVAEIMDICIFGVNKMDYASMPTEGVMPNPNTGDERGAKNTLKTLSDFLIQVVRAKKLSNEGKDDVASAIKDDLKHDKKTTDKLKSLGLSKEKIHGLIEGTIDPDRIFNDVSDKISGCIGKLFYYPRLNPSKLHDYEIDGVRSKWSVSREEWRKVMAEDEASKAAGKKPKYNQGTKPRNNDPEILYNVAGRHLVLIFNCFRGFWCFHEDYQSQLTNRFLESAVLEKNGWIEEVVLTNINMDIDHLRAEVEKYATLNYTKMKFYTHDSYEGQKQKRLEQEVGR